MKLFDVLRKLEFSLWQNMSLLVQLRRFRNEQFPLLKNRWAKHDMIICYSFMNKFCKGYNNPLFSFNCFNWMQCIKLYNKKFAFHSSIRMSITSSFSKWELRNLRRLSHSQLICSTIYKLCREGRKLFFSRITPKLNFNCWQTELGSVYTCSNLTKEVWLIILL